jgi:hypothetical protein
MKVTPPFLFGEPRRRLLSTETQNIQRAARKGGVPLGTTDGGRQEEGNATLARQEIALQLVAKDGHFSSGNFQAHEAMIGIEKELNLDVGCGDAQAVIRLALGAYRSG